MARRGGQKLTVTPELLLKAYASGIFPMAEAVDDPQIFWVDPTDRGVLPLDGFHLPRSLKKVIRRDRFTIRVDTAFAAVVDGCAEAAPGRENTWINGQIRDLYIALHREGFAHSVEAYDSERLVGGLYGVAINGAFFGESMFSRQTDASKVALAFLCERLIRGGYTLLDTQFITDHLARFGAIEIERKTYHVLLQEALAVAATFYPAGAGTSDSVLQLFSQTS
ncbi:leucyl/phenylalanyl-tRNA--protein transferase [Jiella sp. MQZ9-1]|uniref:Leucyl/phenylalanyl-tRNA--protein transferase n=1 Tax=Jiella flava TaxID=2816857 RepID=A0A939FZS8_9HYPH|nr:leucyl/phenylalanyl-tRNA--protein transferase [Jiella flava]MBO0663736.1 leucyl/phenylalanyl-tRNA--protein transferase [Jiella flava]MCD2472308.1 leucyl/phenylalanyl-tRNA--protein transferase [Jiella flava]